MSKKKSDSGSVTLTDESMVTRRGMSRRSLLASTGLGAVLGAAALAAGTNLSRASDAKTVDTDRPPTRSDPDKD